MSLESNKALVRRLFSDVLNRAQPSAINEIVAENYAEQEPFPGQTPGRAGVAECLTALFTVFPDGTYDFADLSAEDNKVVARWTMRGTQRGAFLGVPATNQRIAITGMDIYTFANNQIVSHWDEVNFFSFLAQVNALPKP